LINFFNEDTLQFIDLAQLLVDRMILSDRKMREPAISFPPQEASALRAPAQFSSENSGPRQWSRKAGHENSPLR
jgi:hypothetical protein